MPSKETRPVIVLMAEDDEDDLLLARDAFDECDSDIDLHSVGDGQELMDYLKGRNGFAERSKHPLPGLILLDLNMPRKDGREALAEMKADPLLRRIPVIVFTTSKAEEDVRESYELGVSSFISKPLTYDSLLRLVNTLSSYWCNAVRLPYPEPSRC